MAKLKFKDLLCVICGGQVCFETHGEKFYSFRCKKCGTVYSVPKKSVCTSWACDKCVNNALLLLELNGCNVESEEVKP